MTTMVPPALPPKTPDEVVAVYFQLGTLGDVIASPPIFASDPPDLSFSSPAILDNGATAAAMASGGIAGTVYTVSAVCLMLSGQTFQPVVALPVVDPAVETGARQATVL